jgi:RHS repeat-associated protein
LKFSGIKTYEFEYDGLNRLTDAQYADGDKYGTNYSYDKNGNIDHLERWMEIEGAKQQIDDLVYHYHLGGNQLKVVNDDPTLPHHEYGFADNGSFQNTEYEYDDNGNMIEDLNKGIDLITYNHLNLPTHIYFANNGTAGRRIGYIYTANGIKLRKYTHLNTNAEGPVSDYVGAFVYENNELQFIQTSEGRLVPDGGGGYNYEYALKNLPIAIGTGNTRVMFDQTGEVLQDQSYYPFGLSMGEALTFHMPSTLPDNKYLYNGKELQNDFGLGWYDYGAMFYDPTLGRWHAVDPKSELNRGWSVYKYGKNNPIRFIDPDGMLETNYVTEDGKPIISTEDGSNSKVIVPDERLDEFSENASHETSVVHSLGWNNYWREEFGAVPISTSSESLLETALDTYKNATDEAGAMKDVIKNPSGKNIFKMFVVRLFSQFSNIFNYTPGPGKVKPSLKKVPKVKGRGASRKQKRKDAKRVKRENKRQKVTAKKAENIINSTYSAAKTIKEESDKH